jgi:hypothetical protein
MPTASCEVLTLDGDIDRWDPLPPMHQAREVVCARRSAGGRGCFTAEVYEEALGRWRRLPCNLPESAGSWGMDNAIL